MIRQGGFPLLVDSVSHNIWSLSFRLMSLMGEGSYKKENN
jgi:hypothetical protein